MTKTTDKLLRAATAYTKAKRAVDEFPGPRSGPDFDAACATWRTAMEDLHRAAGAATRASVRNEPARAERETA